MSTVKFRKDLRQGQLGERYVAHCLKKNDYQIVKFNDNSDYDILALYKGNEKSFEVKTDLYEYYKEVVTNNLFIEVMCNGKMSGVNSSKADYFVYFLPHISEMYMIKMDELRKLLRERGFRRSSQSGDRGKVTGYLINRDEAKEWFKVKKTDNILQLFLDI